MPPKYIKVRARSAKEGSATVGWSLALLGPACFAVGKEAIAIVPKVVPEERDRWSGTSSWRQVLKHVNTSRPKLADLPARMEVGGRPHDGLPGRPR